MGLKKKFLKTKPICKVTFTLPDDLADGAETVYLVGDFNDWEMTATPMKRLKSGAFNATLDLETGREYQFRYYLGDEKWENDPAADRYEYNVFANTDNSVVAC